MVSSWELLAFTSQLRISLMSLPFPVTIILPGESERKDEGCDQRFHWAHCGCRPIYSTDRYGILYQITSNSINLVWWGSMRHTHTRGVQKIAGAGLIPLAQHCFLDDMPCSIERREKRSQASKTFGEMCSVPPSSPVGSYFQLKLFMDWNK